MANLSDYINPTSATQAFDKVASAASGLSSTFQQGVGSITAGVEGLAGNLSKAGLSLSNAVQGGISSVVDKFKSEFANLPTPPKAPVATPQEVMAQKKDVGVLTFPSDLGQYFVQFNFYEYIRPVAVQPSQKRATTSISLPLPAQLVENFNMQYEQIEMGQLANLAQDALSGKGMGISDASSAMKAAGVLGGAAVAGKIAGTIAGKMAGSSIAQDTKNAIQQTGGFAMNPHVGLLFKGVNIRAPHTFTYRLSPKTPAESKTIREIVRQLKVRMHPKTDQFTFDYPDMCDIVISRPTGSEKELYKYKACFLETLSVNYAPNGVPTFFAGTREPTDIEISMVFKEAAIFTRDDFQTTSELKTSTKKFTST